MTARRFVFLRIRLEIGRYQDEVEALVDTGCDVALLIPRGSAENLPQPAHIGHATTVMGGVIFPNKRSQNRGEPL